MDFLDDDFGLGTGNSYTRKPSVTSLQKGGAYGVSNSPRKSPKKDQYADQLFDLLSKDDRKSIRKSERDVLQPFSSTFIQPNPPLDFKRTQKWSTPNIQVDSLYQPPKFPNPINPRKNSLAESEDGRSFKSGANNKANNYEFDNLITLRPIQSKEELPIMAASTRSMMKPPLRKKQSKEQLQQDYREPSIVNEDQGGFRKYPETTGFLDFGSRTDLRPKNKEQKSMMFEQKVIPVKKEEKQNTIDQKKLMNFEENVNTLKKQFETEIKQIKQSYDRQLKQATDKLKEEVQQSKKSKTKIINEYEDRIQQDKSRWQHILQQNEQRMKKMHEWEITKKCEAYDMQIQKFKSMAKVQNMFNSQQNQMQLNLQQVQLKTREHQLVLEKKKLDDFKFYLEQREKELQYQESTFDAYRKKQQESIQSKLRQLIEKQNQLRKQQMESKRNIALEKHKMASQLANAEMDLMRKQQSLNLEKEETRNMKQLFETQKIEYSQFNKTLLNDYKTKLQEIQTQKSHLNDLEMELHNKLNTVEVVGQLRNSKDNTTRTRAYSRPSANQENYRNRTNTDFTAKLKETKDRFKQLQVFAKRNCIETFDERQKNREGANLSGYITRLNQKMSKH